LIHGGGTKKTGKTEGQKGNSEKKELEKANREKGGHRTKKGVSLTKNLRGGGRGIIPLRGFWGEKKTAPTGKEKRKKFLKDEIKGVSLAKDRIKGKNGKRYTVVMVASPRLREGGGLPRNLNGQPSIKKNPQKKIPNGTSKKKPNTTTTNSMKRVKIIHQRKNPGNPAIRERFVCKGVQGRETINPTTINHNDSIVTFAGSQQGKFQKKKTAENTGGYREGQRGGGRELKKDDFKKGRLLFA